MKLELKHLAPYLPYGLKLKIEHGWCTMETLNDWAVNIDCEETLCYETKETTDFKPILRPLSDYDDVNSERLREINTDLMNQIEITEFANRQRSLASLSYSSFISLIKDHADVFGLLEKGLAIDYNTITNGKI